MNKYQTSTQYLCDGQKVTYVGEVAAILYFQKEDGEMIYVMPSEAEDRVSETSATAPETPKAIK